MLRVWDLTMSFLCAVQKGGSMLRWFWPGAEWWGPSLSERRIWRKPSKTSFSTKWTYPDMAKSFLILILTLKTTLTESSWLANHREMSKLYFKAMCEFCSTSRIAKIIRFSNTPSISIPQSFAFVRANTVVLGLQTNRTQFSCLQKIHNVDLKE